MDNCCLLNNDNKNKIKDYDYGLEKFELEDLNKSYRQYNIFSEYIDEYVIFVSSGNYKKTKNKYKASPDFAGIAMFFEISGKYDFILKYLTTDKDYANTLKKFSTTSDENEIRVCKVQERYVLGNNGFVNIKEKDVRFLYNDIQLKDYYVFENFVKIDGAEKTESYCFINFLNEHEKLKNKRNNQQYIYIILKIIDVKSKKESWLICTRYKCCDYREGQSEIQSVLNDYADIYDSKKTTFNSNSSHCLFKNIESIYKDIDLAIMVKEILFKERRELIDLNMPIWSNTSKERFLSQICCEPLTKNKIYFKDLINGIKNSGVFLSYKRKDDDCNVTGECKSISDEMLEWLKSNEFENVFRDIENLNPGDSIKDFMEKMSTNDYMIVCANQDYFESVDCMYELSLYYQNHQKNPKLNVFIITSYDIKQNQDAIKRFWIKTKIHDHNSNDRSKVSCIKKNIKLLVDCISDLRYFVPNNDFNYSEVAKIILKAMSKSLLLGH